MPEIKIKTREEQRDLNQEKILREVTLGLSDPTEFDPPEVDETPGFFGSQGEPEVTFGTTYRIGMSGGSMAATAQGYLAEYNRDRGELDPELNFREVFGREDNFELKTFVDGTYSRRDEYDQQFHTAIEGARNEQDLLDITMQYKSDRERVAAADAHGEGFRMLSEALGMAPEVLITAPLAWAAGGAAASRLTGAVAQHLVKVGAVATVEAGVAAAERMLRAQYDLTVNGEREAMFAAAATFGLVGVGGLLGAGRSAGKVLAEKIAKKAAGQEDGALGGSVGAQSASGVDRLISTTTGPIIASAVPRFLRTAKGRADSHMGAATEHFVNTGSTHYIDAANELNRIVGVETQLTTEAGIKVARPLSGGDVSELGDLATRTFEVEVQGAYSRLSDEVFSGKKPPIDAEQFDRLVTRIVSARNAGHGDSAALTGDLLKLPKDQQEGLLAAAGDIANRWKANTTDPMGKRMVDAGMITEDQLIPDYMPVRPRHDGDATLDEYQAFIRESLYRPNRDNIEELFPGVLKDGEDWAALNRRDPTKASEIAEELEARLRAIKENSAAAKAEARRGELDALHVTMKAELGSTWTKRLEETTAKLARARSEKSIAKLNAEIASLRQRLDELPTKQGLEVGDIIARFGNTAQKRKYGKARAKLARADRAAESLKFDSRLDEADRIAKAIHGGEYRTTGNFLSDKLTAAAGITKDRVLDLDQLDPRYERLFETRASKLVGGYNQQAPVRLWLHETYGSLKQDGEDIAEVPLRLIREQAEQETNAAIRKRIEDTEDLARKTLSALLGLDRAGMGEVARNVDFLTQQMAKFNIITMLDMLGVTQLTDIPLQFARGRSIGTGPMGVLTAPKTFRLAKEVASSGKYPDLVAITRGLETMGMGSDLQNLKAVPSGRAVRNYGIEGDELLPGSPTQAKIDALTSAGVTASMWVNFSAPMNKVLRTAMGVDTAKLIVDDMANFTKLPENVQRAWMRNGIDAGHAAELNAFLKGPDGTVNIGGVNFPNFTLLREQRPHLGEIAVNAAVRLAGEALPTVGKFDKTLISRTPMGRLALQFTSFSFMAGVRILPQLREELKHNPVGYRSAAFTLGGIFASMTSLYIRSALVGGEQWEKLNKLLETGEGRAQFVLRSLFLLPFLPGMSSQLGEVALGTIGATFNAATGTNIVPTGGARFLRGDVLTGRILGPTSTQATRLASVISRINTAVQAGAAGESEKSKAEIAKALHTLFISSPLDILPVKLVLRALDATYGSKD